MPTLLLIAAASYLLGSIPFGYLLVRIFRGEDVRLAGSGNIGATNVSRKSPALGVMTLLLDALKGAAAVWLAIFICSRMRTSEVSSSSVMSLAALFAVLGHIFPVWLKFRGGKGVATGLGSFAMIAPKAVLAAVGVFLAVALLFRYVSLDSIAQRRVNEKFLPGCSVPDSVTPSNDLASAIDGAQIVVSVMPSQHCRNIFEQMRAHLRPGTLIISATKGLEENSLLRMTEVIVQVLDNGGHRPRVGALSGPSFALEVAQGDPTAVTVASQDGELARIVQHEFSDPSFRVYTNTDVIGVELGGALKNVVAIAAGICAGLELGHNSVAALITRGLAEMTRLSMACGGRADTMAGLAGLGDLVLTCTGGLSC